MWSSFKGYLDDAAGECELLDKQSPLCRGGCFGAAFLPIFFSAHDSPSPCQDSKHAALSVALCAGAASARENPYGVGVPSDSRMHVPLGFACLSCLNVRTGRYIDDNMANAYLAMLLYLQSEDAKKPAVN